MRPNFHIVEGETYFPYDEIYEDFKSDYLSKDTTVEDIKKKYELSRSNYKHLRQRVMEETGVHRKMSKSKFSKRWVHFEENIDYMQSTGQYSVSKMMQGKLHKFGVYDDIETARYVRDELKKSGWNVFRYKALRFELFGEEEEKEKIERIYEKFKKDFMNGESLKFLMKKYDIGQNSYKILSSIVRSETGIRRKPQLHYKVMKEHERNLARQSKM